ncbi:hypothetical protein AAFF_G00273640 [Aldrovandia affinis]|uniref:Uncharacterized protein n=1 Tax=Aldrovandia affinis TaxID=143900 RepID=A0AAD7SRH9_9TELE|nr:hypothetical protein AAFF_G00273640 [Aldrovandia affinis]
MGHSEPGTGNQRALMRCQFAEWPGGSVQTATRAPRGKASNVKRTDRGREPAHVSTRSIETATVHRSAEAQYDLPEATDENLPEPDVVKWLCERDGRGYGPGGHQCATSPLVHALLIKEETILWAYEEIELISPSFMSAAHPLSFGGG